VKTQRTHGPARLNATVWGELLADYLPAGWRVIPVRNTDGELKITVDSLQAPGLLKCGMVAGLVKNGQLVYLIARVPLSTIIRVLRMDPPKAGETTPQRTDTMHWLPSLGRRTGGMLGSRTSFGGFNAIRRKAA
jgi:hypothetical protein